MNYISQLHFLKIISFFCRTIAPLLLLLLILYPGLSFYNRFIVIKQISCHCVGGSAAITFVEKKSQHREECGI